MKLSAPLALLFTSLILVACGGGDSSRTTPESATAQPTRLLAATTVGSATTFTGKRANYTIVVNGASVTVTDNVGADGKVALTSPSRLVFADAAVAFDLGGTAGKAYRLYQAAFNRTPDLAGLGYWIEQMDKGTAIGAVASQFVTSAEFTTLYGSKPGNADVVLKFYENVLHRKPDQAGFDYWVNTLDSKNINVAGVLANFGESPENQAQVAAAIATGINYIQFKSTPAAIPGILSLASLAACPEASASPNKQFYSCMVGSAVGTTLFGTTRCVLNIASDGTFVMATNEVTRMVQSPYYDAYYTKMTTGAADNFYINVGVSDTKYIGNTPMSGRQGRLQIISPKNAAAGSLGAGIEAHLDDLHCKFPL